MLTQFLAEIRSFSIFVVSLAKNKNLMRLNGWSSEFLMKRER
jgi:hypothetical protein